MGNSHEDKLHGWSFQKSYKNTAHYCSRCMRISSVMHSLMHDRHLASRNVCGVCAASMTGNADAVATREDSFKSLDVRFHEFMNVPRWQRSERENLYTTYRGVNVGVFRTTDNKYQARIAEKISERKFTEELAALRHLFVGLVKLISLK